MQILSKGWKLPENGDFGDVWFPALAFDIAQMNSHKHDGNDSEKISSQDLVASGPQTVLDATFVDQGNGYWRSTVTVPNTLSVDTFCITIKDPSTKDVMHLKTQKLNSTQYYIFMNVVQTIEVTYGV